MDPYTFMDPECKLSPEAREEMKTFQDNMSGGSPPRGSTTTHLTEYTKLSADAQRLDIMLYSTLATIVKGKYFDILSDLKGLDRRYTFAIIRLWKYASLNSNKPRVI